MGKDADEARRYRALADELRLTLGQMKSAGMQRTLLGIIDAYERIARELDQAEAEKVTEAAQKTTVSQDLDRLAALAAPAPTKVTVHSFRVWDQQKGDYVVQPRKSPADRIAQAKGEIIPETAEEVEESALDSEGLCDPSKRQ